MKLLLDTHAFLWFVLSDAKLSAVARSLLIDPNNTLYLSPPSYWELAIKVSVGKLNLNEPYRSFIRRALGLNYFRIMRIKVSHAVVVAALPFHHRDPFDRMLAAQALAEQIPLVSADPIFDSYGVKRLW